MFNRNRSHKIKHFQDYNTVPTAFDRSTKSKWLPYEEKKANHWLKSLYV